MRLSRRASTVTACALGLLAVLAFFYEGAHDSKHTYGNDEASIVEVIHAIEGYEDDTIDILKITDIGEKRYAAFLADNSPGYIQFRQNQKGDYEWESIQVSRNEPFGTFAPEEHKFLIVMNDENRIARMQVRVNGQLVAKSFAPHRASAAWLDWPPTDEDHYVFRDYKYYDEQGNLIDS